MLTQSEYMIKQHISDEQETFRQERRGECGVFVVPEKPKKGEVRYHSEQVRVTEQREEMLSMLRGRKPVEYVLTEEWLWIEEAMG